MAPLKLPHVLNCLFGFCPIQSVPPNVLKESAQQAQDVPPIVRGEGAQRAQDVPPNVREVLLVIKDYHDRGIEPTAAEVAEAAQMKARPLVSSHA